MYFVVNKTKKPITIGDIPITLGPHQAIDLERINKREIAEKSQHLKIAKSRGEIEVRINDKIKTKYNKKVEIEKENRTGKDIIDELKGMREELKNLKTQPLQSQEGISKEDLIDVLKEVIKGMPKEKVIINNRESGEKYNSDEEEVEINEDLLAEINKKAVEKITKNTKISSVNYKEEKKKDDIMNNVSELEGLI